MNDQTKTLLTITILGISLLLALAFQMHLTGPAGTHFILVSLGVVLYAAILAGFWLEQPWTMQLSLIFFALALLDLIWMYLRTHDVLTSAIALLINVTGMAVVTFDRARDMYSLETYDIEEDIRDLKKELESMRNARKKSKRK